VKLLLHVYLIVVPVAVLVAKDVWPAFWPDPWLLAVGGFVHGGLVSLYGFLEWPGNPSRAEVESFGTRRGTETTFSDRAFDGYRVPLKGGGR
jgi:hypothetical protein